MNLTISSFIEAFIMIAALSIDTCIAAIACSISKIKIPASSSVMVSLTCTILLVLSIIFGSLIGPFLPDQITNVVSFLALFFIGIYYLVSKQSNPDADKDNSKSLSLKEAFFFGIAMSIDSIAVGVGAGISNPSFILPGILSLIITFIVVWGGSLLGEKISKQVQGDFSWITGILLIILALMKLN